MGPRNVHGERGDRSSISNVTHAMATIQNDQFDKVVVVVVRFILSRLLYLAFSANLNLLCKPHPGMEPLV